MYENHLNWAWSQVSVRLVWLSWSLLLSLPSSSSPLSFSLSLSLGTLRSDNGDVYENIVEKRLRILNFFVIILSRPGTEKKGIYVGAEERGPRQSSDSRSRSQVNVKLAISRRNCAGRTKKCRKKRDARAKLLFCSLNLLFFDALVAVAFVVS